MEIFSQEMKSLFSSETGFQEQVADGVTEIKFFATEERISEIQAGINDLSLNAI